MTCHKWNLETVWTNKWSSHREATSDKQALRSDGCDMLKLSSFSLMGRQLIYDVVLVRKH